MPRACLFMKSTTMLGLALGALALPAMLRAAEAEKAIYIRETFEAANDGGRVLPSDTTGLFPPKDIGGQLGSKFFAHDQGLIGAGLAGSKFALRAIDSADGNSALRVDWTVRDDLPAPAVVKVQFDLRLSGLAPSPRVKNLIPLTFALRDKQTQGILVTILHHDRDGRFAVRSRSGGKEYELHGSDAVLTNDRDYRFVYHVDLAARKYSLTVTDLDSGKDLIAADERVIDAALPDDASLRFVSIGFGAPDFASSPGAANEFVSLDNVLVCDPAVTDALAASATPPAPAQP